MESLPNHTRLDQDRYIVRTQAGFKQAFKNWYTETHGRCSTVMFDVENWPTSYPAYVTFSEGYRGYHYTRCIWVHVNQLMNEIAGQ